MVSVHIVELEASGLELEQDQVGFIPRFDVADLVGYPQKLRWRSGGGVDDVDEWHSDREVLVEADRQVERARGGSADVDDR